MTNFSRDQVIATCQQYGPQVHAPAGLNPVVLMAAIARNESSFGANCGPRHEPSFDVGGEVYVRSPQIQAMVQKFGAAAACSYGPWQMLFPNFQPQLSVSDALGNLEALAQQFVTYFNRYVIGAAKASTLSEVGMVYNAGHIMQTPGPGVRAYCAELQAGYDSLLPTLGGSS